MDHYGTEFLKEFGRRFNFEVEDLKYFIYQEILTLFDKKLSLAGKKRHAAGRAVCIISEVRNMKFCPAMKPLK